MKVLLDQNLAHDLADLLPGHDVRAAVHMGWDRLANGELLRAAENAGFHVMLTADKNLKHQNSILGRAIGVLVLSTNHWPTVKAGSGRILLALGAVPGGSCVELDIGRPKLRRRPAPDPGQ